MGKILSWTSGRFYRSVASSQLGISRPQLFSCPFSSAVLRVCNQRIFPSPCSSWIADIGLLDLFWFDDHHSKVASGNGILEILDFLPQLVLFIGLPFDWSTRRRVLPGT